MPESPLSAVLREARLQVSLLEFAVANIEHLANSDEEEAIAFFSGFPRVAAVWTEGTLLMVRFIKGPPDGVVMTNAIPVENESEARRWAILLNASAPGIESFPRERTLRLVTRDGIAFPETSA